MRIRLLSIAAALALIPLANAGAEPQILGLLATNTATPLNCTGDECHAEFTSFCMEPDRSSPSYMTEYMTIPGSDAIRVVAHTAAGKSISVPTDKLSFRTERGFAAVRISLPAALLHDIGATRVSVDVGAKVTLRPAPLRKYRRPHEPDEIAHTATNLREVGDRVVDKGGVAREITELTNRLVNALPEFGKVGKDERVALWDKTFAQGALEPFSRSAIRHTQRAYKSCLSSIEEHQQDTLRGCIWRAHDHQVWKLNHRYWNSLTGS